MYYSLYKYCEILHKYKTIVEFNFFRQFTLKNLIFSGFYDVLCPKDIQDNSLFLPEISLNDIVQFSFNF